MPETAGATLAPKAVEQVAKTIREHARRVVNEQPHRARWQFHGGGTGLTHGIVTADLGCGRYTIEKAEWSGDDTTDGIGLGSGSGIGDCDVCYDVTGEGTSACAITLTTPPLQVTGLGVYVRGHDYASTLIPLVVGTGCLIANLGDQDLDGTAIWQIVRGFQHHVVEYKERWDCCAPDGPETLLGRTPVILIGKECDEISCGACPGSGSGSV